MSGLLMVDEPTDAELWAIEAEAELLAAELALVDAEAALFSRPTKATAARYLRALLDVADLHDFAGHHSPIAELATAAVDPRRQGQLIAGVVL